MQLAEDQMWNMYEKYYISFSWKTHFSKSKHHEFNTCLEVTLQISTSNSYNIENESDTFKVLVYKCIYIYLGTYFLHKFVSWT